MATRRSGDPGSGAQRDWVDAQIRHQIGIMRFAGSLRNQTFRILDATETDLRRSILDRLSRYTGTMTPANLQRINGLAKEAGQIRAGAWSQVKGMWRKELGNLAVNEQGTQSKILNTISPTSLNPQTQRSGRIRSAAASGLIHGRTMSQWASAQQRADIDRITASFNIGMVQGDSPAQIAGRVVGSSALSGRDGDTGITRRDAATLTRTAANAVATQSRNEWFALNDEFFDVELFLATLDARTTRICGSLDGERFPIGEGPMPPLHMNRRSLRVALLDPEPIGDRPFNPTTTKQLLREYTKNNGLSSIPGSRNGLPRGHKGAFDRWARGRVREMIGTVPASTTYQQWLKRQPAWFQDDVLGRDKGRLFRRGGLDLTKFVARDGSEFTLGDLARMHGEAFRRAGLDPAEFVG